MKIINAFNTALNLALVRAATSGYKLTKCRANPAQIAAWEMQAICVTVIIAKEIGTDPQKIAEFIKCGPVTIGGIPVERDLEFPETVLEFLGPSGEIITKIENLAIPVTFA